MSSAITCQDIQELLSEYVDDRLDTETWHVVHQHLGHCTVCRAEREAWRLLGEKVRSISPEPMPGDFASRVRAMAVRTPVSGGAFGPAWQRGIAAAVVIVALAGAYYLGRNDAHRQAELSVASRGEPTAVSLRPASNEGERLRAARGVVSDLRFIDQVPSEMQRPLLRAELDHFDLHDWAARSVRRESHDSTTHSVARLISKLDVALDHSPAAEALMDLRDEALQLDLGRLPLVPQAPGLPAGDRIRKMRSKIITSVGSGLPEQMRTALDRYLSLKESIVRRRHFDAVSVYQDDEVLWKMIGPIVEVTMARAFGEDGFHDFALSFLRPLQDRHPNVFRLMSPHFGGHEQLHLVPGDSAWGEQLQRMLKRVGFDGELHIEKSSDSFGSSISVIIGGHQKPKRDSDDAGRRQDL